MSTYPLNEYVQATAIDDGTAVTGTARVSIGPFRYGEQWRIKLIHSNVGPVPLTNESELRVYRGVESDSAIVASTYSGNSDTASGNDLVLPSGDKLVFVWTLADIGAVCTARIEGDIDSRRR